MPAAQAIATTPATPTKTKKPTAGNALTKLRLRAQEDQNGKGGQLRRRKMRFIVDKDICDPGSFDEDFELIVQSASSEVELEALKACADNPAGVMYEMVKRCIVSCDGEPVLNGDGSVDTLWEALGTGGRSLLVRKWNELCGNTDATALGKANGSTQLIL